LGIVILVDSLGAGNGVWFSACILSLLANVSRHLCGVFTLLFAEQRTLFSEWECIGPTDCALLSQKLTRQYYDVTLRSILATIVTVEKQKEW